MQKEAFLPCLGGYGRQETRPKTQNFFFSGDPNLLKGTPTWWHWLDHLEEVGLSRGAFAHVEQCLSKLRVDYDRVCVRASPWWQIRHYSAKVPEKVCASDLRKLGWCNFSFILFHYLTMFLLFHTGRWHVCFGFQTSDVKNGKVEDILWPGFFKHNRKNNVTFYYR